MTCLSSKSGFEYVRICDITQALKTQELILLKKDDLKIAHTLFLHQSDLSDDKQAGSIIFPSYRLAMSKTDRRSERNWDVHI